MNTPISITIPIPIPIPMIIIQLPLLQPQHIIPQNASCVYCSQNNHLYTNDEKKEKKEEKENNEVIYIKEENFDVPEILNDIKQEEFILDVDERDFHQDVNIYSNMYSPISITDTPHDEKRELDFYEIQDQFFDNLMKTYFDDIGEVVEYLKQDMSFM